MLPFQHLALDHKPVIDRYLYAFGEGSCQHSFTSMFCMAEKYGDMFCEKDGFLFFLRSGKCTDTHRVYLFPMGDCTDRRKLKNAVEAIFADAHMQGRLVSFDTVTSRAAHALRELFPGRFREENVRDYAEYIYSNEKLAQLSGPQMASKRHDINTFFRDYGSRTSVEIIQPHHIPHIQAFQSYWLEHHLAGEEDVQLELENRAISRGLAHYEALGLSGIVIYVDGQIRGYAYGAPLNKDYYDVIIEKGDRSIPDIYRVLNRDLVRMVCGGYRYINREEDVGVEGLRKAKLSYKPDFLLEKFRMTEVADVE